MLISHPGTVATAFPARGQTVAEATAPAAVSAELAVSRRADDPATRAGTDFEAVFLRQFVETILPDKSASVFGGGTAGGMWRSLLADGIAKVIAEDGLLGIAKYVAPAQSSSAEKKET